MHCMTYYIFLKSLRILEEFRKIPHIKISPKSPCTKFQSNGKFKNSILIQKGILSWLSAQSAQRASQPTRPLWPNQPSLLSSNSSTEQSRHRCRRYQPRAAALDTPGHLHCKGKTPLCLLFISHIKQCPPSSFPFPVISGMEGLLPCWPLKTPRPLASPLPL
jgi:hypothetical protein